MPRSVCPFVAWPSLTRNAAVTGKTTFHSHPRSAKSAADVDVGSTSSAYPLPWSDNAADPSRYIDPPDTPQTRQGTSSTAQPKARERSEGLPHLLPKTPTSARVEVGPSTTIGPDSAGSNSDITRAVGPAAGKVFTTSASSSPTESLSKQPPPSLSQTPSPIPSISEIYPNPYIRPRSFPSPPARIAALAFRKITQAHSPRPRHPSAPPPRPYKPLFPPAIDRLLAHRLFRMAVFQFANTPEYASDPVLMERIARQLDASGAGRLAYAFRNGFARSVSRSSRKPPTYWSVPAVHPIRSNAPPHLSRSQRLQQQFNAQLTYILTLPANPFALSPFGGTLGQRERPGPPFPSPEPSLRQLGRLLVLIDKLERHRGFVPNRVTANIIVRCWLRCGLGTANVAGTDPSYHQVAGRWTWKKPAMAYFGAQELRAVFEVVSRAMLKDEETAALDREDRLDYVKHVRPFCKMMKRAARELGDWEVFRRAVGMQVNGKRFKNAAGYGSEDEEDEGEDGDGGGGEEEE